MAVVIARFASNSREEEQWQGYITFGQAATSFWPLSYNTIWYFILLFCFFVSSGQRTLRGHMKNPQMARIDEFIRAPSTSRIQGCKSQFPDLTPAKLSLYMRAATLPLHLLFMQIFSLQPPPPYIHGALLLLKQPSAYALD